MEAKPSAQKSCQLDWVEQWERSIGARIIRNRAHLAAIDRGGSCGCNFCRAWLVFFYGRPRGKRQRTRAVT